MIKVTVLQYKVTYITVTIYIYIAIWEVYYNINTTSFYMKLENPKFAGVLDSVPHGY